MWLMTLARWACIPFGLLGGWICFQWARELGDTGPETADRVQRRGNSISQLAGLLALALWCFCPNILAHGSLVTPDMGATAMAVAACYAFWRWLKEPTSWGALVGGLVLGAAQLTKMSLLVLYPMWIVMWGVYRIGDPAGESRRRWRRELAMLGMQFVLSIYVLNLGYGFEGTFTRLGSFRFVSAALGTGNGEQNAPRKGDNRFGDSWLAVLPVPLPKNYVLGIDLQKRDFEDYGRPSYLRGEFRKHGWWYYYLYALAIKMPLGTWVLFFMACTAGWWRTLGNREQGTGDSLADSREPVADSRRCTWRDEFVVLCPAVVILVFVSSQTGFSEHMRYVLPIFPFMFIWISRVAFVFDRVWWGNLGIGLPTADRPLPTFKRLLYAPRRDRHRRRRTFLVYRQQLVGLPAQPVVLQRIGRRADGRTEAFDSQQRRLGTGSVVPHKMAGRTAGSQANQSDLFRLLRSETRRH